MSSKKLLLIEDNEIDCLSFKRMINKNNLPFSVVYAGTAEEARQLLKDERFDVIVADYRLPEGNITELAEYFEKSAVIITTSFANEEVRDFCIQYNAVAYFIKDVNCNYILTMPVLLNNLATKPLVN